MTASPTARSPVPKPLLMSTSDLNGGAARAAHRLHRALRSIDVDSLMYTYDRSGGDPTVHRLDNRVDAQQMKIAAWMDKAPLDFYRERDEKTFWSLNWFPNGILRQISDYDSNIIHLHWIGNGFVPIQAFKGFKRPIVWTLHDMWAFTGGCHYTNSCTRYQAKCGKCPQLNSERENDLSAVTLRRKASAWRGLDLTIVTPSRWLADCARKSALFADNRIEVIPNAIDTNTYKPYDRATARDILGLPQDKQLILAGANEGLRDPRKGVQFLRPALEKLGQTHRDTVDLVVLGASKPLHPTDLGLYAHYPGYLKDDYSLALLYAAADVFVAPSLQDNLPNTVMEALACGIPCVSFNIGGLPDMIRHQENGYLAVPFDVDDLLKGIQFTLDPANTAKLSANARETVTDNFEQAHIAGRYSHLYTEILS